ncbi:MAG: precorrin-6A/cobalt-precorrin-6A reductase, partial [Treponemataceae bacterium]|nr:precorrin-6A/cobalt-precorrin-6A reductase [Treponemataceae bacterium]
MNLLVFAGTTEGTAFTQNALAAGHSVTVSVATDYGADLLRKNVRDSADALRILHGRLDADAIAA